MVASSLGLDGGFGHVMKIFIGAGFPRMGFPGYIVCHLKLLLAMFIFSLIIIFNVAGLT